MKLDGTKFTKQPNTFDKPRLKLIIEFVLSNVVKYEVISLNEKTP